MKWIQNLLFGKELREIKGIKNMLRGIEYNNQTLKRENKLLRERLERYRKCHYSMKEDLVEIAKKVNEEYINHDELMSILNGEYTAEQQEYFQDSCDSFRD
jgi:regulator of replication initiation timing